MPSRKEVEAVAGALAWETSKAKAVNDYDRYLAKIVIRALDKARGVWRTVARGVWNPKMDAFFSAKYGIEGGARVARVQVKRR